MRANMKFIGHLFLRQLLSAKAQTHPKDCEADSMDDECNCGSNLGRFDSETLKESCMDV